MDGVVLVLVAFDAYGFAGVRYVNTAQVPRYLYREIIRHRGTAKAGNCQNEQNLTKH
jgi:hypothetical protein